MGSLTNYTKVLAVSKLLKVACSHSTVFFALQNQTVYT